MFCRKCGFQLPDGAACCSNCGTPLLSDDMKNNDKKVLEDKPYLTPTEFVRSPYGDSLKRDYKKVILLCWFAQIVAVLLYGAGSIVMFTVADAPVKFLMIALPVFWGMFVLQLWACSQVKKKLTKGSVICMIIFSWQSVFGAIFGALAMGHVVKIENAYKEYMYT